MSRCAARSCHSRPPPCARHSARLPRADAGPAGADVVCAIGARRLAAAPHHLREQPQGIQVWTISMLGLARARVDLCAPQRFPEHPPLMDSATTVMWTRLV